MDGRTVVVGTAVVILIIMGCWAVVDYFLAMSDKAWHDENQRLIDQAYAKMKEDRDGR